MNANILTILNNLVSQKSGGQTTAHSNNAIDGAATAAESNPLYNTADNSAGKSSKSKFPVNPRFNDTLQKQMHPEIPEPANESIPKKEKDSILEKIEAMVRQMPYPACIVSDSAAKQSAVPPGQLHLKADTPQIAPLKVRLVEPIEEFSNDLIRPVIQISPKAAAMAGTSDETVPTENIQENPGVTLTQVNLSENPTSGDQTGSTAPVAGEHPQILVEIEQQSEKTVPTTVPENRYAALNSETTTETALETDKQVMAQPAKLVELPQASVSTAASPASKSQEKLSVDNDSQKGPIKIDFAGNSSVIADQASIHKMNVSMEQVNTLKDEKLQNQADIKALATDGSERFAGETIQPEAMEKSSVVAETAKFSTQTNAGLTIGRQIQETVSSIYRPGTQQIVVRLDPPELGRVTIRFIEQEDGVMGILHVEKPRTHQEIQQALPEIVQNLQQSQVQVRKIEVVLNDQQQFTDREEHFHDGNEGFERPHTGGNSDENAPAIDISDILTTGRQILESASELTDKSINVLI